jgi:hypothetical protein
MSAAQRPDLLRRTFGTDLLDCPECGGRLRLIITDREARDD